MKKIEVEKRELKMTEVADPEPKDGEALIKVMAFTVNTSDVIVRYQRFRPFPRTAIGLECSGEIIKLGPNMSEWENVKKVCCILSGGEYAEKIVVPEWQLFRIPEDMSFPHAACLPYALCVAWSELFVEKPITPRFWLPDNGTKARLTAGQCLLVHENFNGISSLAIQMAKQYHVTAIVTYRSDEFREHCNSIGVDRFVPQEDFCSGALTQCADVIFNTLGSEHYVNNICSLKEDGTMITSHTYSSNTIDDVCRYPGLADKAQTCRHIIEGVAFLRRSIDQRKSIVSDVKTKIWPEVKSFKPFFHQRLFKFSEVEDAHKFMKQKGCGKIILVTDAFQFSKMTGNV